jgi:hypothetical protein
MKLPANTFNPSSPKAPQIRAGEGSEGGHWYVPGPPVQCAYEILGVNGKWRSTHIGDARKFGWCPGASSIVRQEASPGLERWKIRQAVLSALTHPKVSEIKNAEELFVLIERDSHEQVKTAASRGTAIHKAIETFFVDGTVDVQYEPYVTAVRRELHVLTGVDDRHAWRTEVAGCHPFGFGGRVDLYSPELDFVIDFKGKEFGVDDEIKAYPEQGRQLAAYREMVHPKARTANLFISRNHPGLIRSFEWSEQDSVRAWREFRVLLTFWQIKNNFPVLTDLAA